MKRIIQLSAVGFGLLATSTEALAVSASPYRLYDGEGLPITNSMVMGWVISFLIILLVRSLVRRPQLIPSTGQAFIESGLGGIRGILESIVGPRMIGPTFPFLIGLFFFILLHNWSGLLPGVGAFGHFDSASHFLYWARPANADLNMTIALGLLSAFGAWFFFVFKYAGLKVLGADLFGNKANRQEVGTGIWIALFPIFFFVGLIEVVSIAFRPVSLGFRLFGNVFGGENLLVNMTSLVPFVVPVPFYFLETLIGLVQAFVFTLLSAVYIGLICNHGDGHAEGH